MAPVLWRCVVLTARRLWLGTNPGSMATYKSRNSLDVIYPDSKQDFWTLSDLKSKIKSGNQDAFSGIIPVEELKIKYLKGSGPGGQHVNKVNSKVEIRFHVERSHWIPEWIRPRLLEKMKNKINKDGYLVVTSERTRKQILNQADCMEKIRTMIFSASHLPQEPTEEDLKLKEQRIARAQKKMLRVKREHSLKKQRRQVPEVGHL